WGEVQHEEAGRGTGTAFREYRFQDGSADCRTGGCKDFAGCAPLAQSGFAIRAVPPDRRTGKETVHPAGGQRPGAAYPGGTGRETPDAPPLAKTGYGTLTNQALAIFPVRMTGAFLIFRRICLLNVFEAVKQSVTTRQAAEHYGVRVGRTGMCVCPFHDDKNPSMKVDQRFHCFGCQADGDVIDFVSRLENVSPKEAALMLAQDFSIPYEDREPTSRSRPKPRQRQESPEQQFKRMERYYFRVLSDYHNLLRRWKRDYAPKTPDEEW